MFNKIKSMFKENEKKSNKANQTKMNPTRSDSKDKSGNKGKDAGKKSDSSRSDKTNPHKSNKTNSKSSSKEKENIKESKDESVKSQDKSKSNHAKYDEDMNWPDKVKAIVIVELMGTPEEHIKNTMQLYLERIKENKDMLVEDEHLEPIEKKESFFLQFTELTITFKSVKNLIEFCFDYMPSSIEIIEPTHITYNSQDLSDIVNDLQAKLHQLDMIVKNLRTENKILNDNGNLLLRNLILVALKEEMNMESLVKTTGINKEAVEKFVEALIEGKLVEEKKGKYKAKNLKS